MGGPAFYQRPSGALVFYHSRALASSGVAYHSSVRHGKHQTCDIYDIATTFIYDIATTFQATSCRFQSVAMLGEGAILIYIY